GLRPPGPSKELEAERAEPGEVGPRRAAPVVARRPGRTALGVRADAPPGGELADEEVARVLDRRAVHARREHRERRSGARGVERRAVDKIERGDPPACA